MFLCLKVVQHVVNQVWRRENRLQNTVHETRIADIAQSDRDMMSHSRSCIDFLPLITLLVYIGVN
jgi:hypothetical protein